MPDWAANDFDAMQRQVDATARTGQELLRKDTEEHDAFRRQQVRDAAAERTRGEYFWGPQAPYGRREPVLPDVTGDRQRAAAFAQTRANRFGQEKQVENDAANQADATGRWNDYLGRLTARRAVPVAPQAKPVAMTMEPRPTVSKPRPAPRPAMPDLPGVGEFGLFGGRNYRRTPTGMERWSGQGFEPEQNFGNWMRDLQERGIY